ncbi:hypothetical protein ACS0TY_033530 [Phlomoides rotata]
MKPSVQNSIVDTEVRIPFYDVCPSLPKKVFLSDHWLNIMKGRVGSEFPGGAVEFWHELIKYSSQNGFRFKYLRNDSRYIHVICIESDNYDCDWFIKVIRKKLDSYFIISEVQLIHKCFSKIVTNDRERLGPRIISKLVLQSVSANPMICPKEIIRIFKDSYGRDLTYSKAYRTVERAREIIFGSYDESYDQLRWDCADVESTNSSSVVILEPNPQTHHFERVFIAFKACINGFTKF